MPDPATPPKTYADLNALVAADAAKLASDQAAKAKLDADFAAASQASADAIAADTTTLGADTAARDAAFASSGKVIVHDNGDGTYVLSETDDKGAVFTRNGVSDATPLSPPPTTP